MSERNLAAFLRMLGTRPDLLDSIKALSKDEVVQVAANEGLVFTGAEYDGLVWDLEVFVAAKREEPFDGDFPLWQTMWGQHYLEFVVNDLMASLTDSDIDSVIAARAAARA